MAKEVNFDFPTGMTKTMILSDPQHHLLIEEALRGAGPQVGHVIFASPRNEALAASPGALLAASFLVCLPCLATILNVHRMVCPPAGNLSWVFSGQVPL
jgi:hypothetical protein